MENPITQKREFNSNHCVGSCVTITDDSGKCHTVIVTKKAFLMSTGELVFAGKLESGREMDFMVSRVAGQNLKEARVKLNLTQQKIAEVLGTPIRTYQKWEQGEVPTPGATNACVALLLKYKGAVKYLLAKYT